MLTAESDRTDLPWEGGPGLPGTMVIPGFGRTLSALFDGQYDIVSWDPRGSASYYTQYVYLSNYVHISHLPHP